MPANVGILPFMSKLCVLLSVRDTQRSLLLRVSPAKEAGDTSVRCLSATMFRTGSCSPGRVATGFSEKLLAKRRPAAEQVLKLAELIWKAPKKRK
jgi:hypothetical protein